jgi:hypothetical protein
MWAVLWLLSLSFSSASPSSAPYPLSLSSHIASTPLSCCQYLKQPNQLIDCVLVNDSSHHFPSHQQFLPHLTSQQKQITLSSQFIFIVFASENINHYASLTLLLNSHFITQHNYQLIFLNESNGGDYYPQDRRWNKIAAVIEALDPSSSHGWGLQPSQYLIAMDADLIILDPSFNLPDIVSSASSQTHLILSADSSDIANTGFMIIKATPWSYSFFLTWYESRFSFDCDQHAFNDLYSQFSKKKKRILILPPQAINTKFPVCATFTDSDSVLHLMGERDGIRKAIFEYAAESFCWDYLMETDPFYERDEESDEETEERQRRSHRYGITQEILSSISKEHLLVPIMERYSQCSDLLYDAPPHEILQRRQENQVMEIVHAINDCFSALHGLTSDLCVYGKNIVQNTKECNDLYEKNYLLAKKGVGMVPFAQLALIDHMARNLYDSFLLMDPSPEAIETGEQVTILFSP